MSDEAPRRLVRLNVDLVKATPDQIAEQLIRVSPLKAAHVALLVTGAVAPAVLAAAQAKITRAVQRVQDRPALVAGKILATLLQEPSEDEG